MWGIPPYVILLRKVKYNMEMLCKLGLGVIKALTDAFFLSTLEENMKGNSIISKIYTGTCNQEVEYLWCYGKTLSPIYIFHVSLSLKFDNSFCNTESYYRQKLDREKDCQETNLQIYESR